MEPSPGNFRPLTDIDRIRHVDHVFVINLDRRSDRLEDFYEKLPFRAEGYVERFAAVDGRALDPTPELLHLFRGNRFGYRRGIIGCALSHYRLWQRIADDAYPHQNTAIFEDDVVFADCFPYLWNRQTSIFFPRKYDLVYIGGLPVFGDTVDLLEEYRGNLDLDRDFYVERMVNPYFGIPKEKDFCTFSYIISKPGAEALCRYVEADGIQVAVDHYMRTCWRSLEVYMSVPLFCWGILNYSTDIQYDETTLVDGG